MPADRAVAAVDRPGPLTPRPFRVDRRWRETSDVTTLAISPLAGPPAAFRPGQFNMLTAFGVGEVPISVSGDPDDPGPVEHTVRDVGPVSRALCRVPVGGVVGLRGPFGTDWGVDRVDPDSDVVVVAGGIGLAPLRGAVGQLVRRARGRQGRVHVFIGARQEDQILFGGSISAWRSAGAEVSLTVDVGGPAWGGHVGVVTSLFAGAAFDAATATALMCGPEVMIRFAARSLTGMGVAPERIRVSLERNMQCGVAWCGHCQLGPYLLCRDGPVRTYAEVGVLLAEREL